MAKTNTQKIEELNCKMDQVVEILPELKAMIEERHDSQVFYARIKKISSIITAILAGVVTVLGGIWAALNIVGLITGKK